MSPRLTTFIGLLVAVVTAMLLAAGTAGAAIAPPWCGTPEPDAAGNLPDGSQPFPAQPNGSFPHIPYYAIGCTLDNIAAASGGRMTVERFGKSALGRDKFHVVINELDTKSQRRDYSNWQKVRRYSLDDPERAQDILDQGRRRREGAALHPGRDPRKRVRGRRRRDAGDRAAGPHAVRDGSRGRPDPRPVDHRLQPDPEPRRAHRWHSGERERVRPQPRLPDAVAAGDPEHGRAHPEVAVPGAARPPRLRDADADRGDDEAAQPGHRVRPVAQVEPEPDRRKRDGDERGGLRRHASDQRLVRRREHPVGNAARLRRRDDELRPTVGRELGRLGPVLHADVLAARRPERLDCRDVQPGPDRWDSATADPRGTAHCLRARDDHVREGRPVGLAEAPVHHRLVDAPLRHGQPSRVDGRPARDLQRAASTMQRGRRSRASRPRSRTWRTTGWSSTRRRT